jgi:metal-dependent hydrolase (beta-lactamase superfamily II)
MNTQGEVDKYTLPNMKTVGLDPSRLKILIMSHGHADHFGGGKYLVERASSLMPRNNPIICYHCALKCCHCYQTGRHSSHTSRCSSTKAQSPGSP